MPFLNALPEKMSEKLGAITALMPMSPSAQAACSRLEPQPKLSPAIRIGLPAWRGSSKMLPGSARTVSNAPLPSRSEEHTSELQSLMRISYAVFCLKKKHTQIQPQINTAHK